MEMAVRQPFTSGSIGRGFKDAFLSTQFWHGLHNAMVAVQRQLRSNLFSSRRCSTTKLPAWLVSVHGNKIANENGDAKQFFLLCSVRSTRQGELTVRSCGTILWSLVRRFTMKRFKNFRLRRAFASGGACGGLTHGPPLQRSGPP